MDYFSHCMVSKHNCISADVQEMQVIPPICLGGNVLYRAWIHVRYRLAFISCQLLVECCVRLTTCPVAFSLATFSFPRQRKARLKEGREMQLLVNRDSQQLQI